MDALDLMWTEPLSWLILLGGLIWLVVAYRRAGRFRVLRSASIAGLSLWLVAAFAITIYPIDLEAPKTDRFYVQSFVPLWGTIESIANSDGYLLDEVEYAGAKEEISEDLEIPVEEVNLDRRVRGVGLMTALKDPIGNVVLFLPLGFLAALGWEQMRDPKRILIAGASVSGGIELSQLLFGLGSLGTIDDVIFNTLGALLGWVGWWVSAEVTADVRKTGVW